jgi:hypothetical protein
MLHQYKISRTQPQKNVEILSFFLNKIELIKKKHNSQRKTTQSSKENNTIVKGKQHNRQRKTTQ